MTDEIPIEFERSYALITEMVKFQTKTISHKDSVINALKLQIKMMRQASEEHFAGHDCEVRGE